MSQKAQGRTISSARKLTTVAVMSALATVLMYLEIPIPLVPSFIKLDFSELPALLTSFALGPWYGVLVCLIKNLLHMPASSSAFIGELSNFLLGTLFVLPAGYIYERHRSKKSALTGSLVGAVCMTALSYLTNFYIVYPFYEKAFMPEQAILSAYQAILPSVHSLSQAILIFNVPFTFVKGMLDVLLTFLLYKRVSPIILNEKRPKKKKRRRSAGAGAIADKSEDNS